MSEDLQERVQELEASVAGLTDELIECKQRIRDLEAATDADLNEGSASESEELLPEADTSNSEESEDENEQDSDDIIVA
ncbi:MAG: DUF7518 family protein [Halococcoides sp.]